MVAGKKFKRSSGHSDETEGSSGSTESLFTGQVKDATRGAQEQRWCPKAAVTGDRGA